MSNEIKNFYDLEAWQKAHKLVIEIYKVTKDFPREEQFGLTSQLKRAAASITANIAEGFERYHFNDKIRFYYQARGSAAEVQNFLILAKDLRLIRDSECAKLEELINEIRRLINGMIKSIKSNQ